VAICAVVRDYLDIVVGDPFSETLNGPNASWINEDVAGLSDHVLNRLMDVYTQTIVPTTVACYSVPLFLFFLLFCSAKMVEFAFRRCSAYYAILSWENKRTSIICEHHDIPLDRGPLYEFLSEVRRYHQCLPHNCSPRCSACRKSKSGDIPWRMPAG
jgi:hypothetical protein